MPKSFKSDIADIKDYFPCDFGININNNAARLFLNFMVIVSLIGNLPLIWSCWTIYNGKKCDQINHQKLIFKMATSILWIILGLLTNDIFPIISSLIFMVFSIILVYLSKRN